MIAVRVERRLVSAPHSASIGLGRYLRRCVGDNTSTNLTSFTPASTNRRRRSGWRGRRKLTVACAKKLDDARGEGVALPQLSGAFAIPFFENFVRPALRWRRIALDHLDFALFPG